MNTQSGFLLGFIGLISLQSKWLSRVFSSTIVWKHQFFSTQHSLWSSSWAGCPGDSQPGKDWDIASLLLLVILARGVSQLIPDRSQTAMGLRMKGECEREDVEMYNSFSELSVEGQSEKLISKWIGRIQSGLPLFCFWLIPFLFVCLFWDGRYMCADLGSWEGASWKGEIDVTGERGEWGGGRLSHNVSACFIRVSRWREWE